MARFMRNSRKVVFGFACVVGTISAITSIASLIDNRIEDVSSRIFAHRASGRTVIVKIDERSFSDLRRWPLPRSLYGEMIKNVSEAGAKQVVIDIDFSSPAGDPLQDRTFAKALAQSKIPVTLLAIKEDYAEAEPIALLKAHADVASSYAELDADGVDREKLLSTPVVGKLRRSIGATLAGIYPRAGSRIHADWSIDANTIPSISFSDVVEKRFPVDLFRGKNVVLGATARSLGDRWQIPWKGYVPGIYTQVIASETLYEGVPRAFSYVPVLFAACLLCALALAPRRPIVRFGATLVATPVVMTAATLAQQPLHVHAVVGPGVVVLLAGCLGQFAITIAAAFVREITHDPLTGLPNLTAMEHNPIEGRIVVAVRVRNNLEITALIGRQAYSKLLTKICERVQLASGGSNIYQVDDHSYCWTTNATDAVIGNIAEGLHALFRPSTIVGETMLDVAIAIGVAAVGNESIGNSIGSALLAADRAADHGTMWERYTSDAEDELWRLTLLGELDRAIDSGDIWVAYQPKYDLDKEAVTGAEALVRWTHPERGPIHPDYFIPLVEEAGRIERLTLHVLKTAIADFARLPEGVTIAINISPKMLGHNRLLGSVKELLAKHEMASERVTLEITESTIMTSQSGVDELNHLRDMGVKISIDDYGTGQSTMSYLKRFPATELKIDQSFVKLVLTDQNDQKLVRSTISLAHELGMLVVAEGVETAEVLSILQRLECDIIQGFYISQPLILEEFIKSLHKRFISTAPATEI